MRAYLDHAATSPLRPEALAAILPYLTEHYANASGSHGPARRARAAVDDARDTLAGHLGCEPGDIVFTSGGTESCNLALLGAARAARAARRLEGTTPQVGSAVLCSAVEHDAVLNSCVALGGSVVEVDSAGRVDLSALASALGPHVDVVSVMTANNEVGTVQPLAEVAHLVRSLAPGAVLHSDAVAAASCTDLAPVVRHADLVSLAAHKVGGPKGVGALVVRLGTRLSPFMYGGPQERERRPGTVDVAGVVAMAAAFDAATKHRAEETARIGALRQRLAETVCSSLDGVTETVLDTAAGTVLDAAAGTVETVPSICHLRFAGVDNEELLLLLDDAGVCASAGAACSSGALEPSHVLLAMGLDAPAARQCVRFSLGWSTTADEVEYAAAVVIKAVEQLRR